MEKVLTQDKSDLSNIKNEVRKSYLDEHLKEKKYMGELGPGFYHPPILPMKKNG